MPLPRPANVTSPCDWLLDHKGRQTDLTELIGSYCIRLMQAGVKVMRVSVGISTLHPTLGSRTISWTRTGGAQEIERLRGSQRQRGYLDSPVKVIHDGEDRIAIRLTPGGKDHAYPILDDLAGDGARDYLARVLIFSDGSRQFVSFASDGLAGFTPDMLAVIEASLPALALRLELANARSENRILLDTYLGTLPGQAVRSGRIGCGEGEAMEAIIWFSDLRGFSKLSDALPNDRLVQVLNIYFDAVGRAILSQGGDILKLIGDGVLAIFPTGTDEAAAAARALAAAKQAVQTLTEFPEKRLPIGVETLRTGVALHWGPVEFGNIGAPDRLDFTVIGRAVNETARLSDLCRPLQRAILMSAAFAQLPDDCPLEPMGVHPLPGMQHPLELFAPAVESAESAARGKG